jgi:hypothetical protein
VELYLMVVTELKMQSRVCFPWTSRLQALPDSGDGSSKCTHPQDKFPAWTKASSMNALTCKARRKSRIWSLDTAESVMGH